MSQADAFFKQSCTFKRAAHEAGQIPEWRLPEIAFVGRSNVGKSSLINGLVFQKKLARTSNTPGRTQQINFFDLGGKLMLADLPGYGYAKIPEKERRRWDQLMAAYFTERDNLKCVCLLIDARHPFKESDRTMMDYLDNHGISYTCVLTKSDAARTSELTENLALLKEEIGYHPAAWPEVVVTSTKDKEGLDTLRLHLFRERL